MDSLPTDVLIEPGAVLKRIQSDYKDLDEPVRCGFTSCRTPHKSGFVVAFDQGGAERLAVIGHICGKQYFGDWEEQERQFRREINIRLIRKRTEHYLPAANAVLEALEASMGRLQWQMHVQQYLERQMGYVMQAVADAVKTNNGYLTIPRRKRPLTIKVKGERFFVMDAPYDAAMLLLEEIKRFRTYIVGTHAAPRETERQLGQIGNVGQRWRTISDWMVDADAAIVPQTIRLLVALHKASGGGGIDISEDGTCQRL